MVEREEQKQKLGKRKGGREASAMQPGSVIAGLHEYKCVNLGNDIGPVCDRLSETS